MAERVKAVDRLSAMIEERDETIAKLERKVQEMEEYARSDRRTWSLPRTIEDDHPTLPVPRLEFTWEPLYEDWSSFIVEYRLVRRHLLGHLEVTPMGSTTINGSGGGRPWHWKDGRYLLPFRDGSHAAHDSEHLGLPLFAAPPGATPHLVSVETYDYKSQRAKGAKHRRE